MTRRPLVLRPFRGLRFDPGVVGDLGTVVSPPYDVLDAAIVQELERANPHNVVRLILSRYFEPPYRAVRKRLQEWRAHGYLCVDDQPGLYLYEYAADGTTVRGLVGLLGLRDPSEGVILPHEDVMPGPVADRTLLMRTTETNLEPILLVHASTPRLQEVYDQIGRRTPVLAFTALDGSTHRMWVVTDDEELTSIATELAPLQALIADGHHRYAAYRRLEDELADGPDSPWRFGLAMLVADDGSSLRIGPIHRVVAGLTLHDVEDAAVAAGDLFEQVASPQPDQAQQLDSSVFWISDGTSWARLQTPRTAPVDAAVLHDVLFPRWAVDDEQVSYHHRLEQALKAAARDASVVVMVTPPHLAEVTTAAAQGLRLPRKSTSFFPKPCMGVVMRDITEC